MGLFVRVSVDELGDDVQDREEGEGKVVGDKIIGSPLILKKYRPSTHLYNRVSLSERCHHMIYDQNVLN